MSTQHMVEITTQEHRQRLDALVHEIQQLLVSKRELTDIVLDALLNTYLQIAKGSGRWEEVPHVLLMFARKAAEDLTTHNTATKH